MRHISATVSEARQLADRLNASTNIKQEGLPLLGIPAPSSCSHSDYSVGYFSDNSILIWSRGEDLIVLDENRTYYRDTVEHLAKCLGIFSQERRAEMLKGKSQWVDGIHWSSDGSFIEL